MVVTPISPGSIQQCEICGNNAGTRISCAHLFCSKCLSEYMQAELKQGVVTLKCPSDGCEELLDPIFARRSFGPLCTISGAWHREAETSSLSFRQSGIAVSLKCPQDSCSELLEPEKCKANLQLSVYSQWRIAVKRYRNGLHTTNQECVTQHLLIKITEGLAQIHCPDPTCKEGVFEPDIC
ncbi:Zinc finger, C3HC4 type (RING finger) [Carex littledalei]|uniref:Zinc finger, C3HC4 type (RING finger) n=1 Tax=Carex littledalei TaxID=544730 RepID=A0A833RCZ4_9POAL|nr:Zinc finger, C3HC4 type (RING finger) [Carex littledalei]